MIREDLIFPQIDIGRQIDDEDMEHLFDVIPDEMIQPYIDEELEKCRKDPIWNFARDNFKNEDDSPWEMSPSQLVLFKAIVLRDYRFYQVTTSTQHGKSLTISRAVLTRITSFADEFLLVVPDTKRGKIIIDYIINDVSKNEYFRQKLAGIKLKDNLLLRLLEEKSKVKLTFQVIVGEENKEEIRYGSVEIISADARKKQNAITAIMGFGGRNVIADESALTDDEVNSGVFRMFAGKKFDDIFFMKIGNPFFRNHFLESWKDKDYKKIYVDYRIGIAEGRYDNQFIQKALSLNNADVLYRCKFPKSTAADKDGWYTLITEEEVKAAMTGGSHFGEDKMGCDPTGEGKENDIAAIIKRSYGYAEILFGENEIDSMAFVGKAIECADLIKSRKLYYDNIGVGGPIGSRLRELDRGEIDKNKKIEIIPADFRKEATESTRYKNKRAECFDRLKKWIKTGGRLSNDQRWLEIPKIKYKTEEGSGLMIIMSKKEMSARGIKSPNFADGIAITFYDDDGIAGKAKPSAEERFFMQKMIQNKKRKEGGGYNLRTIGR